MHNVESCVFMCVWHAVLLVMCVRVRVTRCVVSVSACRSSSAGSLQSSKALKFMSVSDLYRFVIEKKSSQMLHRLCSWIVVAVMYLSVSHCPWSVSRTLLRTLSYMQTIGSNLVSPFKPTLSISLNDMQPLSSMHCTNHFWRKITFGPVAVSFGPVLQWLYTKAIEIITWVESCSSRFYRP